MFLWC